MEQRLFGHTGRQVAVFGQGTWHMELDGEQAFAALRAGLDAGMTHIDTAELYGDGAVEELVGAAIAGRRQAIFLASKVLPEHASYQGTLEACAASLRRLRTDYLDLYMLHWPGPHPLGETIRAFERLRTEGKIRDYGVSNFDENELAQAIALAGEGRIACNQVLYHLGERHIEHAVLPACQRHGIALVAYSPFGSGRFPPRGPGAQLLAEIARAHEATPRQVALRYLVRAAGTFVIPKASRPEHVLENAGAARLTLSADELGALDRAFPLDRPRRSLPML